MFYIVLVLGFNQLVAYASSFYLFAVLGDPIANDLPISSFFLYNSLTAAFLLAAILGPSIGRRVDKHGGRQVQLASHVIFFVGLTLLSFANGEVGVFASMLILGIGMAAGLSSTSFAILVNLKGLEARKYITTVALIGGLGGAIGWPVTLYVEELTSWRGALIFWAVLHLSLCVPASMMVLPKTETLPSRKTVITHDQPVLLREKGFRLAVLFSGAWFVSTAMSAHLPRLFVELGLSIGVAVGAAAMLGVSSVAIRFIDLIFPKDMNPVLVARIATTLHPIGALLLSIFGPIAAPILSILQGAGNGLLSVSSGVLPLTVFGKENYAYKRSVVLMPAKFIQAFGPSLYGIALSYSVTTAIVFSSVICIVMFTMTFRLVE